MDKLRLRFSKEGRAKYISHLDLMRTMQRALLRAGLPLRYSEGFNPHAVMSILLPLSVGMESGCELMDFNLAGEAGLSDIPQKLNCVLPEGIAALKVYEAARKAKEIKWLRIEGHLEYDRNSENMATALTNFFARESIVITRKTKRGEGEIDIAPEIREIRFESCGGNMLLEAVISAQEPALNPENLISALRQLKPEFLPAFAGFRRLELYDANMQIFC